MKRNGLISLNILMEELQWIQKDPFRYGFLRDFLNLGASVLYEAEDGVVLKRGRIVYSAGTVSEPSLFSDTFVALVCEPSVRDRLMEAGVFGECFECLQAVYTGDSIVPECEDVVVRQLELSDMPFVLENYHHPGAKEKHIRERLNDYMVGAFVDGRCAGFAGIHEEGAMGLLEVLPDYRRRGIAEVLESSVINWCIRNSRLPYCHVLTNNTASIALQNKLKLKFDNKPLYWLS